MLPFIRKVPRLPFGRFALVQHLLTGGLVRFTACLFLLGCQLEGAQLLAGHHRAVTKLCSCASICLTAAAASGELRPDCRYKNRRRLSACEAVLSIA